MRKAAALALPAAGRWLGRWTAPATGYATRAR